MCEPEESELERLRRENNELCEKNAELMASLGALLGASEVLKGATGSFFEIAEGLEP